MNESANHVRSIYLAGQLKKWDWRHTIVQGLKHDAWDWRNQKPFPIVESAIYGRFPYVGPFWPYSKCPNNADNHLTAKMYRHVYLGDKLSEKEYWQNCRDAIERADLIACVFGDYRDDVWTGASELLCAASIGKPILSINHSPFSQLVAKALPECKLDSFRHPRIALAGYLGITTDEINQDNGNGFVYFIESNQKKTQQIKIGWAYDPIRRLKEFQTGSPTEYKLLGTLPAIFYFTPVSESKTKITVVGLGYNDTEQSTRGRMLMRRTMKEEPCYMRLRGMLPTPPRHGKCI